MIHTLAVIGAIAFWGVVLLIAFSAVVQLKNLADGLKDVAHAIRQWNGIDD